jgi:TonB family protein
VPLDHYKTQVLLLHSEQSALDTLRSGFGDRYTVHCATSGTEALTTLGETPINVIISAQELPGMSGVEALREAKKRSPDTIGILLAGKREGAVEALVGEREVFQVVHGHVTGEGLKKLVDGATQQMRLMALAESANDMAANPDEPAEHIVMETSENGSTIISDGTGQFPALNPSKISAAAAVGSQTVDVLVLTKDQEFLTTIRESSRGMHQVHYANTLKQADELIRKHKVGVAVVDAAMVGEKVEQLTLHLRKGSARLVSIVAGRRDDGEMLMDLINRGKVYRFLLKPVSPGRARLAVEASVKHHLEAPDAAFKTSGSPAPAPKPAPKAAPQAAPKPAPKAAPKPAATAAPKPAPKAAPKPAATAAPKPAPKATPKPARQSRAKSQPAPKPVNEKTRAPALPAKTDRMDPPLGDPSTSPNDAGLAGAFGEDDTSFAGTLSNMISSVGKKFSGEKEEQSPLTSDTLRGLEVPTEANGTGGSKLNKTRLIGIGAAVLVLVAGSLYWFMGGQEEPAQVQQSVVASVEEPVAAKPQLTETEFDFGSSVEDSVDMEGLVDDLLAEAESALLESRLDDAVAALQRVRAVDPEHARLPFLTAQLSQLQLRGYLSDARAAIRDTRFEDAAESLARARALGASDTIEIDAIAAELSNARSQQRADEVLALAAARLEEGDLIAPANNNARYYYGLVLSNDPGNTAASQGMNIIASKLVLQARAEIDDGNLDAAEGLLDDARTTDASSSELAATTAALVAARDAIVARERRAAEQRRLQQEQRQAELQREEDERKAAEEAASAATAQPVDEAPADAVAEESVAEAADTSAETSADDAVEAADTPAETSADDTVADGSQPDLVAEPAESVAESPAEPEPLKPVAVSSLTRTKYVAPKYPRAAQRRGESGWVDVMFTVAVDGTVKEVIVRGSTPEDLFVNSAVRAVERWEFEPYTHNGEIVEIQAGVRMMFALE